LGAARKPRLNLFLRPDSCIGAQHATGREAFALNPIGERLPVVDDLSALQIVEAKKGIHGVHSHLKRVNP
jgi:hypothetical protein